MLLASHEADYRLIEGEFKNRIALMYLPLVGLVLDHGRRHLKVILEGASGKELSREAGKNVRKL